MIPKKRYHPLSMMIDLWGFIKGAFIPALFLFVVNDDSTTFIWKYGRYAFLIITILAILFFVWKWLTYRYELTENAFHLYAGYINKEEQIVAFNKIQNSHRKTSILHRFFHLTSIQFETAMTGKNATVSFNAIRDQEAAKMEALVASSLHQGSADEPVILNEEIEIASPIDDTENKRTVHFKPTKQDTFRASFTSLSFLVLIPILFSMYSKFEELFDLEQKAEGIISMLLETWWITAVVIISAMVLSTLIGITRIYLKYGKYEISSDNERIYILQGILNETSFSIDKKKVQAINIQQSFVKRLLGIVEVKLISTSPADVNDDDHEVSSLYPFLKKQRAYVILEEILPEYQLTEQMTRLPRRALWLGLIRVNFIFFIPAGLLLYFKPSFWVITEVDWPIIILLLFTLINVNSLLHYWNSAYRMNQGFIQIKKGALGSSLFLSKRTKIMEVSLSRSFLQRKFGVASLEIVNRAHPAEHTKIDDVPLEAAGTFYYWYRNRTDEMNIETREDF